MDEKLERFKKLWREVSDLKYRGGRCWVGINKLTCLRAGRRRAAINLRLSASYRIDFHLGRGRQIAG